MVTYDIVFIPFLTKHCDRSYSSYKINVFSQCIHAKLIFTKLICCHFFYSSYHKCQQPGGMEERSAKH